MKNFLNINENTLWEVDNPDREKELLNDKNYKLVEEDIEEVAQDNETEDEPKKEKKGSKK